MHMHLTIFICFEYQIDFNISYHFNEKSNRISPIFLDYSKHHILQPKRFYHIPTILIHHHKNKIIMAYLATKFLPEARGDAKD